MASKLQVLFGTLIQDIESEKGPRRVASREVSSGDGTILIAFVLPNSELPLLQFGISHQTLLLQDNAFLSLSILGL